MSKKLNITKKYLEREYIIKKIPATKIAKKLKCNFSTIYSYLKKYNIPRRTMREIQLKWDEILTKKFLIKEYIKNKKHTTQIAKEIGSNHTTVANYLRKYNIRIRSKSETMRGSDNPMFGVDMKGEKSPSYIDGRSSKKHPCIEPGCKNMVHYTTAFFDGGRCRSCARREQYKDPRNHPNWHDGSSFEPYPLAFTEKLRRQIRKRDNHICQLCGRTEKQNNRALSVHHIDYNKENCSERNLISLCKYCHTKVNADRNYWTSYFKQKTLQLSTV